MKMKMKMSSLSSSTEKTTTEIPTTGSTTSTSNRYHHRTTRDNHGGGSRFVKSFRTSMVGMEAGTSSSFTTTGGVGEVGRQQQQQRKAAEQTATATGSSSTKSVPWASSSSHNNNTKSSRPHIIKEFISNLRKFDMYGYDPSYKWTNFTSGVGTLLTFLTISLLVFYVFVTTHDYINELPELNMKEKIPLPNVEGEITYPPPNQIGFSLTYKLPNSNGTKSYDLDVFNKDRYFRYQFQHVTITEQDSVARTYQQGPAGPCHNYNDKSNNMICMDNEFLSNVRLEGTYVKPKYQYMRIQIMKCTSKTIDDIDYATNGNNDITIDDENECASMDEINDLIESGNVKYTLFMEVDNFDITDYAQEGGTGIVPHNIALRYYPLPNYTVKTEVFLLPISVYAENKHIGSPPISEKETGLLDFERIETIQKPTLPEGKSVAEIFFRLNPTIQVAELAYWSQSLLDLFGLWGAMVSFCTVLSFGFVGTTYNKWKFHHKFQQRTEQNLTESTSTRGRAVNNNGGLIPHSSSVLRSPRMKMSIDDIRLFSQHHFDEFGRLLVSPEEMKFPITAFGELRTIALREHSKKIYAAQTISHWYLEIKKKKE